MIERALTAGVPVSWVLGDEVYGNDRRLRLWLEQHERPHVLAVKATEPLWALVAGQGAIQVPAKDLATAEPLEGWRRLSAGAKGERLYDWARFRLFRLQQAPTGCWCAASSPSRTRWHITSCSARPPPAWRPDRRSALAGRGVLRDGQAGGRAGRLRGAQLARLGPAHHLIDAGARLPGGDAGRTRLPKRGRKIQRIHCLQHARDPSPHHPLPAECWPLHRLHSRMVALAAGPSDRRQSLPLETTDRQTPDLPVS